MHDFYTKDRIELPISSDSRNSITTIPNFYRYFLLQILNMINSLKTPDGINYLSDKLDNSEEDSGIKKYNRILKRETGIQMISETELNANRESIYYEGESDNRNETLTILEPILKNNNVFITIGKEMIMIMNKFPEDSLKTKYIPPQKRQLEKFFKFTAWVLSKEYVKKCLEILESGINPLVKIDDILKNKTIFHMTSLQNYDIHELNTHVEAHKQYVKDFIISKDPYLCKNFSPILTVNPVSDISSSILHFHIQQDILHTLAQKMTNYKYELLKTSQSIFDFQSNAYRVGKLLDKFKINKKNIANCLLNPYVPSMKLTSILTI
jgi:hypothetical protein